MLTVGSDAYLWVKTLHVISMITWMAGLFYLPRLYVYHAEVGENQEQAATFKVMERRLLAYIMNPSVVIVFATGAILSPFWLTEQGWLHLKILLVVLMAVCHILYAFWQRDFVNDTNTRSGKFYRIANEVPTLLLIAIIALVIVKPF